MREVPLLKRFKTWAFKKKAEVEKMFSPKMIDERMIKEKSYELRNRQVLQIRKGNYLDVEAIMEIQEACYNGKAPWGRFVVYNEIQNPYSFFLLATNDGEPVAFIGISLKRGQMHITNVATKPNFQKQGLASFLIESVADIGRQIGQTMMSLEVRVSNTGAIRLYKQLGFKEVYVKKKYYQDNGEDALEMHYKIEKDG